MPDLPRVDGALIEHTLKVQGDRRSMADLLPRCEALFIYPDEEGCDWLRFSLPPGLMDDLATVECPCCGGKALRTASGGFLLDVAYDEVDWYFRNGLGGSHD
jgi:hypothetical protein